MTALPMTLDRYMELPWEPQKQRLPSGGVRLQVPPLADFEIYADTEAELDKEWRTALRAHLRAYLQYGKAIPLPQLRMRKEQSGIFRFGWEDVAVPA
jgi:hypothetical protein